MFWGLGLFLAAREADEPTIADAIAAVQKHIGDIARASETRLRGDETALLLALTESDALHAALTYLEAHELVVAERDDLWAKERQALTGWKACQKDRDAARAELAEAKAVNSQMAEDLSSLNERNHALIGQMDALRAPLSEDAKEAAKQALEPIRSFPNSARSYREAEGNVARALTAAREAEREKCRGLVELLRQCSDKLCHYATDYPQPDALSLINKCDRALAALDEK